MTNLLAIDTSTDACSVALHLDGRFYQTNKVAPQQHTKIILPMIAELLGQHHVKLTDLAAVAFAGGPGSFTGVRIAASVTQGLAFAADLPVIRISTLRALAQAAYYELNAERVLVAVDARLQEVYWNGYLLSEQSLMMAEQQDALLHLQDLPQASGKWVGVGDAWEVYQADLQKVYMENLVKIHSDLYPQAKAVAELALVEFAENRTLTPEQAVPVYLKDAHCKKIRIRQTSDN